MKFTEELGLQEKLDRTQLANYLSIILKDISLEDFAKLFINDFQAVIDYYKLSNGEKTGQKISLLFNPHRLNIKNELDCTVSLFENLQNPLFYNNLVRVLFLKNYDLYQTCFMGIGGAPIIAEFPPHVMRDYCNQFHLNKESKVLDPCAGWGGVCLGLLWCVITILVLILPQKRLKD